MRLNRLKLKLLSSVQLPEFIVNSVYLENAKQRVLEERQIVNSIAQRQWNYLSKSTKLSIIHNSLIYGHKYIIAPGLYDRKKCKFL